jgi:DNA (cytosine-5)-methyltransferase 1
MTSRGHAYELPTSARRTDGNGCSSLPTPRATDWKDMMHAPASLAHAEAGRGTLSEVLGLHMLPTPRATDGTKGGPNQRGSSGDLMLPSAVLDL